MPSWEHTFEVQVRSVTPDDKVPTLDRTPAAIVTKVEPPVPSYDNDAEIRIIRLAQS
jgi:hypothetical protein